MLILDLGNTLVSVDINNVFVTIIQKEVLLKVPYTQ